MKATFSTFGVLALAVRLLSNFMSRAEFNMQRTLASRSASGGHRGCVLCFPVCLLICQRDSALASNALASLEDPVTSVVGMHMLHMHMRPFSGYVTRTHLHMRAKMVASADQRAVLTNEYCSFA